jgi:hypothetical protein
MLKTVGNPSTRSGNQTIVDGNLIIGTAGRGVDFSADPSAPGMTSELLDDYEEGTWTPQISFEVPGDLSIVYSRNAGRYQKIGNTVYVSFTIFASTFTHSTASGVARITGLPFTQLNVTANFTGVAVGLEGYTKANYTTVTVESVPGTAYVQLVGYGSGQGLSGISAADMPSGTRKIVQGQFQYQVNA